MKKWLTITGVAALLMAVVIAVVGHGDRLQSSARHNWKQKSIAGITTRIADPAWSTNEIARLNTQSTSEPNGYASWLSDHMIVTCKGEWLAYANICRKEAGHIHDLFLARGSDGQWYYSTYHFCIGMLVLKMEEQPEDLAGFARTYFLRTFDGQSDDCQQKTWPPKSR